MVRGLVLHSGGIDSTVCLAIADEECNGRVHTLSFDYGQRHYKEIKAAREISGTQGFEHHVISLDANSFKGFGSTLVDDLPNPHLSYEQLRESEGPSPTYVPQRNLSFLSEAARVALIGNFDYIYFGAHADDAHNFAYPDCTPEFIGAIGNAIYVGSYYKTRLRSPLMWMTKAEVVRKGFELNVDFSQTWSCYEGGEVHCGICPTCVSRKEAFSLAKVNDPTEYTAVYLQREEA